MGPLKVVLPCPAADALLDAEGRPRLHWFGLIAFYGPPAADLAAAGRWGILGLFGDFASRRSRHVQPCSVAERLELIHRPMATIVGRFGFPSTREAANVLSKLTIDAADEHTLAELRARMNRRPREIRPLAHLPRINLMAIEVLDDAGGLRRHVAPSLLRELAMLDDRAIACDAFEIRHAAAGPWQRLLGEARRLEPGHRIGRLRSMADVESWATRLAAIPNEPIVARDEFAEIEASADPRPATPPAPDGEPGRIEALVDADACAAEGEAMQHCAAERWAMVADGYVALYCVIADAAAGVDRATLELAPLRDGRGWAVQMLRGAKNGRASLGTWRRVHDWLAASGVGIVA